MTGEEIKNHVLGFLRGLGAPATSLSLADGLTRQERTRFHELDVLNNVEDLARLGLVEVVAESADPYFTRYRLTQAGLKATRESVTAAVEAAAALGPRTRLSELAERVA